jgi:hypothetical protein
VREKIHNRLDIICFFHFSPNPDKPVEAKRKSRFIGEPKKEKLRTKDNFRDL